VVEKIPTGDKAETFEARMHLLAKMMEKATPIYPIKGAIVGQ
jgi:hypothetical protein